MGRVAPVLDTCTRLLLVDLNDCAYKSIVMVTTRTIPERVQELVNLGICLIICGAVSDRFFRCITDEGIHLICGIAGDIDAVIAAYKNGTLERDCFRMPGADRVS